MGKDRYRGEKGDVSSMPIELKRRLRQLSVDLWIWEVASLTLSASCVGAIIVILLRYDHKPLPVWNYGLTINGVISVLAVIAKASMILPVAEAISQLKWHWYWKHRRPVLDFQVLDTASRGPWGCWKLLCRPRQWSVATLGALITLGALMMEPSLQLIPSYHNGWAEIGTSWVARAMYFKDYQTYHGNEVNLTQDTFAIGTGAKESFYGAMFRSADDRNSTLSPSCPTGNCTWPSFSSLAVCSTCFNVSSNVQFSGKHGNSEYPPYTWHMGPPFEVLSGQLAFAWNTARPVSSSHNFSSTNNQTIFQMLYMRQVMLPSGLFTKPEAHQCLMFMCVKTYEASMREGIYQEDVTSSWPSLDTVLPDHPSFYDTSIMISRPSQVDIKNYTIKPPGQDTTYVADTFSIIVLQKWLSGMVDSLAYTSVQMVGDFASQDMGQFFYDAQGNSEESGPGPVIERIADGLTSYMRSNDRNHGVPGSTHGAQTIVRARWYWASLPVALVGLTFMFMAFTISMSVRNGIPVWKSSGLAVMVHGLSDDVSSRITAKNLNAMESNAEDYIMAMQIGKPGWRLKGMLQ